MLGPFVSENRVGYVPALFVGILLCGLSNVLFGQTDVAEKDKSQQDYRTPKESDGILQWRFNAGQKLGINTDQYMEMAMDFGGQKVVTKTKNVTTGSWLIESVDSAGTAASQMTVDRMKLELDANGMKMDFDTASSEDADPQLAEVVDMIKLMIGKPISYEVTSQGKAENVNVPDDMFGETSNPILSSLMNKQTFVEMTKSSTLFFPKSTPEIGDTWSDSNELDMGMFVITNKTEYKYLGVEDRPSGPVHVIGATITQEFSEGGEVEVDIISQNTNAKIYFDGIKGRMLGSQLNQDVKMEISTMGQVIDQHITQKLQVDIKE